MVGGDGAAHGVAFAVRAEEVRAKRGVRALGARGERLADVMEEACAAGGGCVEARLCGHHAREEGHLHGVPQHVLRE